MPGTLRMPTPVYPYPRFYNGVMHPDPSPTPRLMSTPGSTLPRAPMRTFASS